MAKIIAIANQKGGVGKTTTIVNLSAALVVSNYSVLVIDLDPQGNATTGSGINKNQLSYTVNDVLLEKHKLVDIIQRTQAGYDLAPANSELTEAEVKLLTQGNCETSLRDLMRGEDLDYNFIFIDCPPSLNALTINALVAADSVLIPIQCEYYALEGLASLLETIKQLKSVVNKKLAVEGLLRTMYDGRNRLAVDVSAQLLEHFGKQVYRTVIPRNVRLAEAPSHGIPAVIYDKTSQGGAAYFVLAAEFINKQPSQIREDKSQCTEGKQASVVV